MQCLTLGLERATGADGSCLFGDELVQLLICQFKVVEVTEERADVRIELYADLVKQLSALSSVGVSVKRGAGKDGRESLTCEDTHGGLRRAGLREEDQ